MIAILLAVSAVSGGGLADISKPLSDYAFCVAHDAIVAQRDKTRSVQSAVQQGFDDCKAKRAIARKAFVTSRLSDPQASNEMIDHVMEDNDRQLAEQLNSEISEYRRTGKIPTNAQN